MDCLRADGLKGGEDVTHSLPADLLLCWAPYTDKHKHTCTHTHTYTVAQENHAVRGPTTNIKYK